MEVQLRERLVHIIQTLMDGGYSDEAVETEAISELERSVPHPAPTDLIYHMPTADMSAEEILDLALGYKPIRLGPPRADG